MKEASIILILVFCFICCKSDEKASNMNPLKKVDQKNNVKLIEQENPILKIQRIAIEDIEKYKLLWNLPLTENDKLNEPNFIKLKSNKFDISENNYLVGTYYSDYLENKILAIDENTLIIPIRFRRQSKFSYWNIKSDSINFIKFLDPAIGGTYQMPYLDTIYSVRNRKLLIGTTRGGEGDDVWEELWTKEIKKNDTIVTLEKVNYEYIGSMKGQSYVQEIQGNKLIRSIYIDSVNGQKDTTINVINLNNL